MVSPFVEIVWVRQQARKGALHGAWNTNHPSPLTEDWGGFRRILFGGAAGIAGPVSLLPQG
ncbi:MAG: hypothetical protein HXX11_13380 [Desulfuromonadales bacterium]|nr:hypothetical protein [Desulfuromonadales bacterium]